MPTSTPPTDPDSLAILHALSAEDLSPEDAYNALGGIRNMSGQTIAAAIEAQNAKFEGALEALRSEIRAGRWMAGIGLTLLGLLVTLLRFLD